MPIQHVRSLWAALVEVQPLLESKIVFLVLGLVRSEWHLKLLIDLYRELHFGPKAMHLSGKISYTRRGDMAPMCAWS